MSTKQKSLLSFTLFVIFYILFLFTKIGEILDFIPNSNYLSGLELLFFIFMSISFFLYIRNSILERNLAYRKLDEQRENLKLQLDSIDLANGIIEFDLTGKVLKINKKFTNIFGFDENDFSDKTYHNLIPNNPKDLASFDKLCNNLKLGKDQYGEYKFIHKNGEVLYVICIFIPVRNKKNDIVKIIQISQDNTQTRKNLIQIIQLSNNLKDIEGLIEDSMNVCKYNVNGNLIHFNQKVTEFLPDIKLNDNFRKFIFNPNKKEFLRKFFETILMKDKVWHGIIIIENNGELFWIDTVAKAIFDPVSKEYTGFLTMGQDITNTMKTLYEIDKKNVYLEYAAKILRHDMHSGINTYIPRGVSSLKRRLKQEDIDNLKLEMPLKLISEGLKHAQKIYKGVYEFTNLVRPDTELTLNLTDLSNLLKNYLKGTAYFDNVKIDKLPIIKVNESLFCTAIDNLIRNGLKYNDSDFKLVKIYYEDRFLIIEDNGRGLSKEEFEEYSKPYNRKPGQKESGSGLGLNICLAILKEHKFDIDCEQIKTGTRIKIKIIS